MYNKHNFNWVNHISENNISSQLRDSRMSKLIRLWNDLNEKLFDPYLIVENSLI